jgi:hydrogenase expression/formation protein HypE
VRRTLQVRDAAGVRRSVGAAIPISFRDEHIELVHGAGGKASRRLIEGLIAPHLMNGSTAPLGDAAIVALRSASVALTTDAFVVRPLRFPGGSIGDLAVNGTVNDLAVSGARPRALVCSFILEAGLDVAILRAELEAMRAAAERAGVLFVGGDTKVVGHGEADDLYVTTTGIGDPLGIELGPQRVKAGDRVLVSGPIGDHGITILLARGEIDLRADLQSDSRSVWPFVEALLGALGDEVHWMRDPTRGGVATSLNELARDAAAGIIIDERLLPIRDVVKGASEILGIDPLHVANEGQFLAIVARDAQEAALAAIRAIPGGEEAAAIGEVVAGPAGLVQCRTPFGSSRIVDMLVGDPLPRIC